MAKLFTSILIIQFIFFTNIYLDKAFPLSTSSQIAKLGKNSKTAQQKIPEINSTKHINNKIKKTNFNTFLEFLTNAYNLKDLKKISKLDKEWKNYSDWTIKNNISNFLVNLFFGITSFLITFLVILFISSGNFSTHILIIWLLGITLNIIAKILYEKNREVLFHRPNYSLSELLKKEYNSYKNLKIYKKQFNTFSPFIIANYIAYWQASQNAIFDFCLGVLGGFIAIGIFNPMYLIPYSIILVFSVTFIMICVFFQKNDYDKLYEEKKSLSEKNNIYSTLEKPFNITSWNNKITTAFNNYDKKRLITDTMLRILVSGIIPALGVFIFLFSGTSNVILIFYILSLNLFTVFSLVYYFREGQKGINAKKEMFAFLYELMENKIIINNYNWNKNRKSLVKKPTAKININNLKNTTKLFLENFCLTIKNGETHNVFSKNEQISMKKGSISVLTGKSGSGKTSTMQFLGAKLFLNKQIYDENHTFCAKGTLYVSMDSENPQEKKINIEPCNITYETLQKLVCYYSFDDIDKFNIDVDIFPNDKKKQFLQYMKKLMPEDFDETQFKINGNLSSGERARVKLALILTYSKEQFIILDQPFIALDNFTAEKVFNILHNFAKEKNVGILIGQPDFNFDYKKNVLSTICLTKNA